MRSEQVIRSSSILLDTIRSTAVFISVPISEQIRKIARQQYRMVLPPMEDDGHDAHITVLYLENVFATDAEILDTFRKAMKESHSDRSLTLTRLSWFEPSEPSAPSAEDGKPRMPIKMDVDSPWLHDLNALLLRAFFPISLSDQFIRFAPHMTLGYAHAHALTEEQRQTIRTSAPMGYSVGGGLSASLQLDRVERLRL